MTCCQNPLIVAPTYRVFVYDFVSFGCIRVCEDCVWEVEQYGKLLSVGGGKERMTAHWDGESVYVQR